MQADNEDRYSKEPSSAGLPTIPLVVVALLALAALGYWYLSPATPEQAPPPPEISPVTSAAPVVPAEPEPAPDIPVPVTEGPEPQPETNELSPPPPEPTEPPLSLKDSDPVVRKEMSTVFEDSLLAAALTSDSLIERSAALIDITSQGRVEPKLFPLPPPQGKFPVVTEGDNIYVDSAGFRRYDTHARAISALNPQLLASAFHEFRPLLEEAYAAMGYKSENMDNSLIRALDQVINAPVLEQPALLVKEVSTYNYADENLEALSPLAKQLLRMGPENQVLIQAQAKAIRAALLAPPQ